MRRLTGHERDLSRFAIIKRLLKLRYGESVGLSARMVRDAFPPTGDYDISTEGVLRAMALADAGHRPESSYTTTERLERDLDGSFTWQFIENERDVVLFHRHLEKCPKCGGSGHYLVPQDVPDSPFDYTDDGGVMSVCTERFEECDHAPED